MQINHGERSLYIDHVLWRSNQKASAGTIGGSSHCFQIVP